MKGPLHNEVIEKMLLQDEHLFDVDVAFVEIAYSSGLILRFSFN